MSWRRVCVLRPDGSQRATGIPEVIVGQERFRIVANFEEGLSSGLLPTAPRGSAVPGLGLPVAPRDSATRFKAGAPFIVTLIDNNTFVGA